MPNISKITHEGVTLSLKEWAARKRLRPSTIHARINTLGWDVARALDTPAERKFSRGGRGGRKSAGEVRPCPPMKRRPKKNAAYCRWWVNGVEHTRQFGAWGSDEAAANYSRFAAEWAAGVVQQPEPDGLTIAQLALAWLAHCKATYQKRGRGTSEYHCAVAAVRHLGSIYGTEAAASFDGRKLRVVREAMIGAKWARGTVNKHVGRVVRMFGWGATESLVPVAVRDALALVEPIAAGRRPELTEPEPVEPVPQEHIEAVLSGDRLHPTPARRAVLAAMVRLQLLTGMRPGELCSLRVDQIDRRKFPWRYQVVEFNKMLHKDVSRPVFFGPLARSVLAPLLDIVTDGAEVFRYPPWRKGAAWSRVTTTGYRGRIKVACKAAGVPTWTPNQLRHNKATELMDTYENDKAAAAILGNTPEVSRQIYAHRAGESVAARIAEITG